MAIGKEINDFAEVMQSRMMSFDEKLGVNNYLTNTSLEQAVKDILRTSREIETLYRDNVAVSMKVKAVDMANQAMIIWKRL